MITTSPLPKLSPLCKCAALLLGAVAAAPVLAGNVYTETNAVDGNQVVIMESADNGMLTLVAKVSSGGLGTGAGLGNQGALSLDSTGRYLLAVNAGSNDISVFQTDDSSLYLLDVEPTMGTMPVSVTVFGSWVYVLNAGNDTLTGFRLGDNGQLTPMEGSERALSATGTGAAQVSFDHEGDQPGAGLPGGPERSAGYAERAVVTGADPVRLRVRPP